jgi:hypothetical protein
MPIVESFILYLSLGAFAGVMAGLLGVGGGLIIVPALVAIWAASGVQSAHVMHLAVGTSLATIVLTSISSVRAHHVHGAVAWPVFWRLAPGIVVGAALGAGLAAGLPGAVLKKFFGVFELAVAVQLSLGLRPKAERGLPGPFGVSAAGGVIGVISAILGIGGGTLTVPFLTWCGVSIQKAVATSAACGLPIAVAGSLAYVAMGWNVAGLPAAAAGYVYIPALAGVAAASVLSAPLGARLAHRLSATALKRVFAVFLAALGVWMLAG